MSSSRLSSVLVLTLVLIATSALSTPVRAGTDEPVAVFAEIFNGYARTRLPDGSFKPETYVFGEGGSFTRNAVDPSLEKMPFERIARTVATTLARLNYQPAPKPAEAQLMILVFWGSTEATRGNDSSAAMDQLAAATSGAARSTTTGVPLSSAPASGSDPDASNRISSTNATTDVEMDAALAQMALANAERDRIVRHKARILGYEDALDRAGFSPHMSASQNVISEISANRYFIVLQAYDFPTVAKFKKLKPLWTARVSVEESGDAFDKVLDHMLAVASPFLGKDSGGLRRNIIREGHVEVGAPKVIEEAPKK